MTHEKLGPPTVEGLSDVAWARVERGTFARLDGSGTVTGAIATRDVVRGSAPRRTWMWIAVPLAAAAACLFVLFATRGGGSSGAIAASEPARVVSGASPSAVS